MCACRVYVCACDNFIDVYNFPDKAKFFTTYNHPQKFWQQPPSPSFNVSVFSFKVLGLPDVPGNHQSSSKQFSHSLNIE